MEVKIIVCDIKGCGNDGAQKRTLQTIFHEKSIMKSGLPVCAPAYLALETIDLCSECYNKILTSGRYVHSFCLADETGKACDSEYYLEV